MKLFQPIIVTIDVYYFWERKHNGPLRPLCSSRCAILILLFFLKITTITYIYKPGPSTLVNVKPVSGRISATVVVLLEPWTFLLLSLPGINLAKSNGASQATPVIK